MSLSELEFDVLWQHLDLGEMPLVLRVPSPGATHTERAGLVRAAWDSLEAKGYGRQVNLDPVLHRVLLVLARPDVELDARLWLGPRIRLLAARRGAEAVLVRMSEGILNMREIPATGLSRAALAELPDRPAGPGISVTLPTAQFEAAARDGTTSESFEQVLCQQGVRPDDARQLRTMIGDLEAHGQFGVAVRDSGGRRHRGDHVVAFFDTSGGRYLQVRRESSMATGTTPWSTISPADSRRMLQHVQEMLTETASTVGR